MKRSPEFGMHVYVSAHHGVGLEVFPPRVIVA